ncbi:MAG TPA: chemotaxis protein CheA [Phycisphaerae bacterium]|nr:chemotaxis protein CheA [Phycisphaerae bacterium]
MTQQTPDNAPELLKQLAEAAGRVDAEDLTTLAKMHGWAVAYGAEEGVPEDQVGALTRALEGLIIGTTPDVPAALSEVATIITELSGDLSTVVPMDAPADAPPPVDAEAPAAAASGPLAQLLEAAQRVDANDLTLLAEMHTLCQQVAAEAVERGDDGVRRCAAEFAECIEGVILGTEADPADALRKLVASITDLQQNGPGEAEPDAVRTAALSDDEVAARLDEAFALDDGADDAGGAPEPAASEADAAPAPAAKPAAAASAESAAATEPYIPEPLRIDAKELEFVAAFIQEAGEHLENIEAALLEVEQMPDDKEKINELFRPFHTIKGMAGFLNLRDVNCLTHEVETLLDQGRRGERTMTPGCIDLVFEVIDILKAQIGAIATFVAAPTPDPIPQPPVAAMIDRLRGVVAGKVDPDAGASGKRRGAGSPAEPAATPAVAESPAGGPSATAPAPVAKPVVTEQSVRIDTNKLDALVDMVGELVIAQTLITSSTSIQNDPKLSKDAGQVSKIVRDVQEAAMAMRMVPIKSTFQKMARLVRDLSRKAGKHVELAISGEETELDKNVIQQIGDPLVHMVRNAVDHGIEPEDARVAAGKRASGQVSLNAFHHSGNIVIEISDDGKGLDPEKLRAKAIDKGILSADEVLTDEQAYNLIFAAGFSTAEQITDISGRGVGMDVVRRNIEQLRGRVEIVSEKGRGSTFSIRLPLTLAIIDGMLVRIGAERFIIATNMIEQALRPRAEMITTVQNRGEVLNVRGRLIPLIQLGQMFAFTGRVAPAEAMVVIAHTDAGDVGLVVDELIGQQQVVIKTLGEQFSGLRGISGAAILGDGRVGLILDPSGLHLAHELWHGALVAGQAEGTAVAAVVEPEGAAAPDAGGTDEATRALCGSTAGQEV